MRAKQSLAGVRGMLICRLWAFWIVGTLGIAQAALRKIYLPLQNLRTCCLRRTPCGLDFQVPSLGEIESPATWFQQKPGGSVPSAEGLVCGAGIPWSHFALSSGPFFVGNLQKLGSPWEDDDPMRIVHSSCALAEASMYVARCPATLQKNSFAWNTYNLYTMQQLQWTLFQWGQKWALNREIAWKTYMFFCKSVQESMHVSMYYSS